MYNAKNMNDVKFYNKMTGHRFFDHDTMEFWGSRVESELFLNNTFVTSEDDFYRTKKLFTVRRYNPENGEIETVGKFQQFDSLKMALAFAENYKEDET